VTRDRSTDDLVARLAGDLAPVRLIASLRRQLAAVAAIWAVSGAVVAAWLGIHPLSILARGGIAGALVFLLAIVGFAGVTLALAVRIPGRERLAIGAACGVALGITLALAMGIALAVGGAGGGAAAPWRACAARSMLFAVPPALLATALASRGAPWRPLVAGPGVAVGALALGALLVHLSCPSPSSWHWLVSHAFVPLAAGAPLGLLIAHVFDRLSRGSRLAPVSSQRE
jgi:hypothetical protein